MLRRLPLVRRKPKQIGAVATRWRSHRQAEAIAVALRVERNGGRCEGCGQVARPHQWAHLAGRRHIIAEPWASDRNLTRGLCMDCHDAYDRRPTRHTEAFAEELRHRLGWQAVDWLVETMQARGMTAEYSTWEEPIVVIRRLVSEMEKAA